MFHPQLLSVAQSAERPKVWPWTGSGVRKGWRCLLECWKRSLGAGARGVGRDGADEWARFFSPCVEPPRLLHPVARADLRHPAPPGTPQAAPPKNP